MNVVRIVPPIEYAFAMRKRMTMDRGRAPRGPYPLARRDENPRRQMSCAGSVRRPSSRWALDRGVVIRAAASFSSGVENTLDTLDGVDVVRGVVARAIVPRRERRR